MNKVIFNIKSLGYNASRAKTGYKQTEKSK